MNYTFEAISGSLQYHFKKKRFSYFMFECSPIEIGEPRKNG